MAIRQGLLKLGTANADVFVFDNTYRPRLLKGAHEIHINFANTFKVADEPNFFGAYHGNPTFKTKIYRDLRHQANVKANVLKRTIMNQFTRLPQNDPQFATYYQMSLNSVTTRDPFGAKDSRSFKPVENVYQYKNEITIYVSCHFDDVNLYGALDFPINISTIGLVYE